LVEEEGEGDEEEKERYGVCVDLGRRDSDLLSAMTIAS
jgi:hypothetical protein